MNITFLKIVSKYFSSWWIPSTAYLLLLVSFIAPAVMNRAPSWKWLYVVSDIHFAIWMFGLFGVICAAVWNLVKKRWVNGIVNLILFFLCCTMTLVGMFLVMMCIRTGQ